MKNLPTKKPLFVPLKAEFFNLFESGEKTFELRRLRGGWNGSQCHKGRDVTLSYGYGKQRRLYGKVGRVYIAQSINSLLNSHPHGGFLWKMIMPQTQCLEDAVARGVETVGDGPVIAFEVIL